MLETYKATLHGDKIEWETDAPTILQKSVEVFITIVRENGATESPNGKKMAQALEKIALKGGVSTIEDASRWQREQRLERELAKREE